MNKVMASPFAPWLFAALAVIIIALVLLLKRRKEQREQEEMEAMQEELSGFERLVEEEIRLEDIIEKDMTPEEKERQRIKQEVEKLIDENPENAAQVLKTWLLEDLR
ncbi:hypothetical protein [Syntrophomonas palmitatica]|uniref:hypothetical protein n=1 Tax=Syntrophomonas palmitatica TaxID=402877 RepID=UPI0006D0CF8A|nr:hypothetical protein [Syntrophomonas palmitatica]